MKLYINSVLLICAVLMACNGTPANKELSTNPNPSSTNATAPETKTPTAKEVVISEIELADDPVEVVKTTNGKINTVTVSSLEEMVDNAKSNTIMYLEKGTYHLETNLVYYMTKDERKIIDKNEVQTRSIGGQLFFNGLENFQLIGKKGAQIVSKNPKAVALFAVQGKNLKFSNLIVKKVPLGKADLCYIANCKEVEIDNCNFDGGGTYGLYISNAENIKVKNCKIRKCHNGAVRINNSRGVSFVNSIFSDNVCTVPIFNFYGTECDATLNNVTISNNKRNPKTSFTGSDKLFNVGINGIKLENCVIQNNKGFKFLGVNPSNIIESQIDGVSM